MKALFLFLLLFFPFQIIFGQPQLSRKIHQKINSNGIWENYEAIDYKHDERGNKIEELTLRYDTTNFAWLPHRKRKMGYDERNNMTRLYWEYIDSIGIWKKSDIEYIWKYNEDNCLEERELWNVWNIGILGELNLTHYYYSDGCKLDSSITYDIDFNPDSTERWRHKKTFIRRYENNDRKIIDDTYWEQNDEITFSMENASIREIDGSGRALLSIDSLTDIGAEKREYTYYQSGKRKSYNYYHWRNYWNHEFQEEYRYSYNSKGLLTNYIREIDFNPPSTLTVFEDLHYDYYCDDLLRTEFNTTDKYIYLYDSPTDCFDIENEGIDAVVSPNPATDIVRIYSTALQVGDLTVSIFDTKGSMVYRKEMEGRNESLEMNVRQYVPGIYFVNLTGLGETETVKLFVKP